MIVGIDVDGVLANFSWSYANILTKHTGISFPDFREEQPKEWYWERSAGVEKNRENVAWQEIKQSHTFWKDLLPEDGAPEFLKELRELDHDVYFITNRMGLKVKWQTEQWLKRHGYHHPTVLICRDKGKAAEALELTHYIDDKTENCQDVAEIPACICYMLAKDYNSTCFGVPRVRELSEFMEVLRG